MSRERARMVVPSRAGLWLPAWHCQVFAAALKQAIAANRAKGYAVEEELVEAVWLMERTGECSVDVTRGTSPGADSSESRAWTPKDAAALLGVEPPAVRALCRRQTLRSEKVDGRWLIDRRSVLARVAASGCDDDDGGVAVH